MSNPNNIDRLSDTALDWNAAIESDGQRKNTLLEGDYNFTITNFERGYFSGSEKLPPSNKAVLTLQVATEEDTVDVRKDIILNQRLEFLISAFFRSIGMKKRGERLVMDWSKVQGKRGRAHFKPRTYRTSNGDERQVNDVEIFYDYDEKNFLPQDKQEEIPDDEMFS